LKAGKLKTTSVQMSVFEKRKAALAGDKIALLPGSKMPGRRARTDESVAVNVVGTLFTIG